MFVNKFGFQKCKYLSYVLLFNAQQGNKQIIYSEICHDMHTFTAKFIPYKPFIPGLNYGLMSLWFALGLL